MPSRPFVIVFTLAVAALLGACSVKNAHSINISREGPTEIGKNDGVVAVLASYIDCENSKSSACDAPKESASVESSFEGCIGTAIRARVASIVLLRAREVREKVFPGMTFTDSPHTESDLLVALSDTATRTRMETLGLRYILVLHAVTRDGDGKWSVDGSGGRDGGVIGFMKQWERRSDFRAVVVDIYEGNVAGTLDVSNAQHKAGGGRISWSIPFPFLTNRSRESPT